VAGGSWRSVGAWVWGACMPAALALSQEGPASASSSLMNSLSLHHRKSHGTHPRTHAPINHNTHAPINQQHSCTHNHDTLAPINHNTHAP